MEAGSYQAPSTGMDYSYMCTYLFATTTDMDTNTNTCTVYGTCKAYDTFYRTDVANKACERMRYPGRLLI